MLIIDRFEGKMAVIEYGEIIFHLPRSLLPQGAKEGDVISLSVSIDEEGTARRLSEIRKLMDELFEK